MYYFMMMMMKIQCTAEKNSKNTMQFIYILYIYLLLLLPVQDQGQMVQAQSWELWIFYRGSIHGHKHFYKHFSFTIPLPLFMSGQVRHRQPKNVQSGEYRSLMQYDYMLIIKSPKQMYLFLKDQTTYYNCIYHKKNIAKGP